MTEVEVLAFHDKSTMCWLVPPEPLAVSTNEVEVLVTKEMLAEVAAVAVGAKLTVKGTLCPAASVTGSVRPPTVKTELLELTEETVTLPPLAVIFPLWLWAVPMVTVPKFIDPGVNPSVPLEVVALPVRDTATEGLEASELSVTLAVSVPAAVGAKITDRLALPPAASV